MPEIVFLDRDGVINRFPGKGLYVTNQDDFHFLPGSLEAIALLSRAGKEIYVISNQGCVSRGLISKEALGKLTERMLEAVRAAGGKIKQVYYCLHQKADRCDCKKPKTKLFLEAIGGRQVDLANTFFIGDSEEDIEAGKNLGCRTILVLSGRTQAGDVARFPLQPDAVKEDLWGAARWLLEKKY